jgi:hypothetical protein
MRKYKVYFKNGEHTIITEAICKILYKRLTSKCGQFQSFEDHEGTPIMILNTLEIILIQEIVER